MTKQGRKLVLTLVRFQNEVDRINAEYHEAHEMDRGFDGGEFSGPATQRAIDKATDRAAVRFGFANADVAYAAVRAVRAGTR